MADLALEELFARRTLRMGQNDVSRMIARASSQPGLISLGGGLPAPELFPIDRYRRAFEWVMETDGAAALQYGPTEGHWPLRQFIAERMVQQGVRCTAQDVLVTNGSQQGLDSAGKAFLDKGDQVVVENPSYLGALQAFSAYEPEFRVVPMDDDGMQVDVLEPMLAEDRSGAHPPRIKFIYLIPNFQNPTGRTLSRERRLKLVQLSNQYVVPILEDDPYGELRYEGEPLPSLKSLDRDGTVVYLGTFSKMLSPGFRLGWAVASPTIFEQFVNAKQPVDLNTSSALQMVTLEVAKDAFIDRHLETVRPIYKERRDVMLETLARRFAEGTRFTRPQGGLFVWVELPGQLDAVRVLDASLDNNVAFVPGRGFHPDGSGANSMRLNFSNAQPEKIREAITKIAAIVDRQLAAVAAVR